MEAIILAGGFGTRLQSVVNDVPKPMAPVRGKPFLYYLLRYLLKQKITHIVLSVGYKYQTILDYFGDEFHGMTIDYVVEEEPLGTGGGISEAMKYISGDEAFVLNGDTFFDVDLADFLDFYKQSDAIMTMALKNMKNFDRYGIVKVVDGRVRAFLEKAPKREGAINGGVYILSRDIFKEYTLPAVFSFENFLETNLDSLQLYAKTYDAYFIDIGIPEDYDKAQKELVEA